MSCIADGPDSIFADIVVDLGGKLDVVVPASRYRDTLPVTHHSHYDRLFSAAHAVIHIDREQSTSESHMRAGEKIVDLADHIVAVWDGKPSRGLGGTADVVAYAKTKDVPVTVVWPEGAQRE